MPVASDARRVVVPGKVEIMVAFPGAYANLFYLGESEDGIEVTKNFFYHSVKGDSQGGTGGPDIEKQFLGLSASFRLQMSKWDPVQIHKLETVGGLLATNGLVPDAAIGALVLSSRSIRVLLLCTRDMTRTINFPCCVFEEPHTQGLQTKYSRCGLGVQAYRTPKDYWYAPGAVANVVWDYDTTGL